MSNPYQPQDNNTGQFQGQPMQEKPMQGQPMGQQMPGQYAQPYEHPQEQTVMILAILGIFVWICAPIAWYMGNKAKKEMTDQNMEPTSRLKTWTTVAMVFTILGIVGIALFILTTIISMATVGLALTGASMAAATLPALAVI